MRLTILFFAMFLTPAQTPTGLITGTVRDESDALIVGSQVRAVNKGTGLERTAVTGGNGAYAFISLPAGEYEVSAQLEKMRTVTRTVTVATGASSTSDFILLASEIDGVFTVVGVTPEIRHDSYSVSGSITPEQIEAIPLNGRGFQDLNKTQPGGQQGSRASSNRNFAPILGAPGGNSGRGTVVTIDGASIMAIGNGGSALGFSQEGVREFQVSSANFDLSTGLSLSGSINVTTRYGTKDVHGSAFWYFRDHNLSAYPAITRDPANPDPFFQRRQFGFALGGPIRRKTSFFFVNWERNDQRGVGTTTVTDPDLAGFSRITPSPFMGDQINVRLDANLSPSHTGFFRYSHDGNHAFGPPTNATNAAYPSSWSLQSAWVDQGVAGVTSAFPSMVNDLRLSYFVASTKQGPARTEECLYCLGIGAPVITVFQTGLTIGGSDGNTNLGRRFQLNDVVNWQLPNHRLRFGADWQYHRGGPLSWTNEPASITVYSPTRARQAGLTAPAEFHVLDDILALPLRSVTISVGDPRIPQAGGGLTRVWNTARLFVDDTWNAHRHLVVSYGLAWNIDRNLNYDLRKPSLLAPLVGENGLGPTRKEWKNFSPAAGFAWTPAAGSETVIRGGAGLYYDFLFQTTLDTERAAFGPAGLGRQTFQGSSILNVLPGIPGVPVGAPLNFSQPTAFTGANLIASLPLLRSDLLESLKGADPQIPQIQITKSFSGGGLNGERVPTSSALHASAGFQRRVAGSFIIGADFVYKHFSHVGLGSIDLNHFNSAQGPVIRKCDPSSTERTDPLVSCSNGAINFGAPFGRATYRGVLLRIEKRRAGNYQVLGSWAFSRNTGTGASNSPGFDLTNWLANQGPLPTDFTHILNVAGTAQLPQRWTLGFNFSYASAPPFSAFLSGVDFNGDGTVSDLLPGSRMNEFNRGKGRNDLALLVDQYNQTIASQPTPSGVPAPSITLPASFALGDNFHSLDLRLSRSFSFHKDRRLTVIGDVFNVYNASNFSGYSGDLTSAGFGQPSAKSTQVFGSGGPRAVQVGVRVGF